jgi:hypothetical protein
MQTKVATLAAPVHGEPVAPAEDERRCDTRLWSLCAWSGPVYLIVLGIAFSGIARFVPPPREHWSALEVAHFYSAHDVGIRLGMEGMLLIAPFYYFWTLAVARVIAHTERSDSPLSRIQLFGGLSTAWVTAGLALAFLVAAFRAGHRDPNLVQLMNDIGWMIFNLTAMFTFFQIFAMGIAWLRADARRALVPRWVAYLCFCDALTFLVVFAIPFLQTGPFAWHGFITFYLILSLFGLWMCVTSRAVIRANRILNRNQLATAVERR